jgi:hypothetical protein
VIGSLAFLHDLTQHPPGSIGLITGPSLPDITRTSLETLMNGVGPHRYGQWPRCDQGGCSHQTSVICPCPKGHGMLLAYNKIDQMLYLTSGQRALVRGAEDPDNLRGMAACAAWIDEITLCRNPEVLPVVQGRLLDLKGRLRFTGTPKGKNWLFQDVMQTLTEVEPGRVWRSDRWEVFRFPTRDNPGIEERELDALAAGYPARLRQQELEGEFVDWGGVVFSGESITAALQRGVRHYGGTVSGHTICIGVDPAGKGRDWWGIIISCLSCRTVIYAWRDQRIAVFRPLYERVADLAAFYRADTVYVDETSLGGQVILEELRDAVARRNSNAEVSGYPFTQRSKYELLQNAAARLEEQFGLPDPKRDDGCRALVNELRGYELDDKKLVTDMVMAFAMSVWPLQAMAFADNPGFGAVNVGTELRGHQYTPQDWEDVIPPPPSEVPE